MNELVYPESGVHSGSINCGWNNGTKMAYPRELGKKNVVWVVTSMRIC